MYIIITIFLAGESEKEKTHISYFHYFLRFYSLGIDLAIVSTNLANTSGILNGSYKRLQNGFKKSFVIIMNMLGYYLNPVMYGCTVVSIVRPFEDKVW